MSAWSSSVSATDMSQCLWWVKQKGGPGFRCVGTGMTGRLRRLPCSMPATTTCTPRMSGAAAPQQLHSGEADRLPTRLPGKSAP
eukprot:357633-Chlamydomonas_euryale.AAC.13